MKRRTALLLVLLAFALAGCASYGGSSPPPTSPGMRCLSDPSERGTRPLIFLFCIQSA